MPKDNKTQMAIQEGIARLRLVEERCRRERVILTSALVDLAKQSQDDIDTAHRLQSTT